MTERRLCARAPSTTLRALRACSGGPPPPLARGRMELIPCPMKIRQRRRAPDIGLAALPGFRPLRRVLMPGPRLEVAEVLVDHLVELAEELDHLIVGVAVVGGDVVPWPMAQRAPDDRNLALAEQVAGILQVDEV